MSASAKPPASLARFSTAELEMLAKTADALSAYLGQPVLAEVAEAEEGTEWVAYGIALDDESKEDEERPHIQMGGKDSRILGGRGGLTDVNSQSYDCLYLWAIQISLTEGERFIKIDQDGEECAWSDSLTDVLPFDLSDTMDDLEDIDDEDEDDEDGDYPGHDHGHHGHRH